MTELVQEVTAEEIARHYSAAMDSVNLINGDKPEQMEDADWADTIARNKEHLKIMLAKDFWTTEDLAPLQAAAQQFFNHQENDMGEKKTTPITIDNVDYTLEDLTQEQQVLFNHCLDLDRKISSAQFNLDQLQVGKQAFFNMLKDSLPKETQ